MSALEWLEYRISDLLGEKTYAESQSSAYKAALSEAESEIVFLEEKLSLAREFFQEDYDILEVNPESAEGKLSDIFAEKETGSREAVERILWDLWDELFDMKMRAAYISDQFDYWSGEAEREDREMRSCQEQYDQEKGKAKAWQEG